MLLLIKLLFSYAVFIVSAVIALPCILVFRLCRRAIKVYALVVRSDLRMMDDEDAIWMQGSSTNPSIINSVVAFEQPLDVKAMQDRWARVLNEQLMHDATRKGTRWGERNGFMKMICTAETLCGFYFWKFPQPGQFEIERHIYRHETDGDEAIETEEDVLRAISDLCSRQLPSSRAQWQFVVLERTGGSRKSVAVFRCSHAVADGVSLMRFLDKLFIDGAEQSNAESAINRVGMRPLGWLQQLGVMALAPLMVLETLLLPACHCSAWRAKGLTGRKRVAWSGTFKLQLVRQLKTQLQCSFNDLVMAIVAGMLQRWRNAQQAATGQLAPQSSDCDLLAFVPVYVHSSKTSTTLELRNSFAIVPIQLPASSDVVDAQQRLEFIKEQTERMKKSAMPIVNIWTAKWLAKLLPSSMSSAMFDVLVDKGTAVLSNVPGPTDQVSLGGNPIGLMIFWPPQRKNIGLGVSIITYWGSVQIGVMTDEAISCRPQDIVQHVPSELSAFKQLAANAGR